MVRFRSPRGPLLWINNPEDLEVETRDGTLHLKNSKGSFGNLLVSIPFLLIGIAVISASFIYTVYEVYSQVTNDSVCDTRYFEEFEVGGGDIYCEDKQWDQITPIRSVEVADQHFKYTMYWDDGYSEDQEFRWSMDNEMLAIGLLNDYDGETSYECSLYKMESSLSQNWTVEELMVSGDYWYAMPGWCHDGATSTANLSYSPAVGPLFEGEVLYLVDGQYQDINAEKYTENSLEYINIYAPYDSGVIELLFPFIFGLIFGGIFLSVGDSRGTFLMLDGSSKTIRTRKVFGGTRLSGWTWSGIDFSTLKLRQYTKSVEHSSGGGDNGPVHHWTTYHKGIEVTLFDGRKPIEILFLEHGDQFSIYDSTIKNLCDSLGVELPEMIRQIEPSAVSRTSHENIRLKDFPVREWDSNNDAKVLVSWFNNESARSDNYSLSEALEATGMQGLNSTEDAQNLLDHLVELLRDESSDVGDNELPENDEMESDQTTAEHDGDTPPQTSNAFWNES